MLPNARRIAVALVNACAIFGLHIGGAAAQVATVTVDENCNGTLVNPLGETFALPCSNQQDTGPGGQANALTYGLLNPSQGVTTGDLILLESAGGPISDILRFNPTSTFSVVFYSDITPGESDPARADLAFPTGRYANTLTLVEVGLEGNNGLPYTPAPGQPGFVPGVTTIWVIRSDTAVPEPGSLALAIGVGLLGLSRRRQKA